MYALITYKFLQGLFWPTIFIFILFFLGLSILAGEDFLHCKSEISLRCTIMGGDHESQEIFQLGKQRQLCDAAYLS